MTHANQPDQTTGQAPARKAIWFDRRELETILWVYGRLVAEGECRDYAIGAHGDHAVFCMFKHAAEAPSWTVEKWPELARKQGAYSVVNGAGLVLRRGHDLTQVLKVFEKKRFQVID